MNDEDLQEDCLHGAISMNVDATLQERGSTYGDYYTGVCDRSEIMDILTKAYARERGEGMPVEQEGMLWDIVNKLCRLAVTPDHVDSWHDIQGYAKLSENHFTEKNSANK